MYYLVGNGLCECEVGVGRLCINMGKDILRVIIVLSFAVGLMHLQHRVLIYSCLTYVSFYHFQMNAECSDDVSLKKLLKAKPKGVKKKVNPISVAAEYDMERLCRAKAILEKMKQKVVKLQNGKARKSSKTRPLEEFIVYIPIAELRGKN